MYFYIISIFGFHSDPPKQRLKSETKNTKPIAWVFSVLERSIQKWVCPYFKHLFSNVKVFVTNYKDTKGTNQYFRFGMKNTCMWHIMHHNHCGWKVENFEKAKVRRNNERESCETFFNVGNICQKLHSAVVEGCLPDHDHHHHRGHRHHCHHHRIIMFIIMVNVMILLVVSDGPISGANRAVFVRGQCPVGRFLSPTFSLFTFTRFFTILFLELLVFLLTHLWRHKINTIESDSGKLWDWRNCLDCVYVYSWPERCFRKAETSPTFCILLTKFVDWETKKILDGILCSVIIIKLAS